MLKLPSITVCPLNANNGLMECSLMKTFSNPKDAYDYGDIMELTRNIVVEYVYNNVH